MHPVPQGLTVHAAGFGRRFAVNAIEHQRKRKYPTRRRTIFLSARRLAKLRSRQIKSGDRYRRSHRCRSSQRTASSQSFTDLRIPNESQFRATGITYDGRQVWFAAGDKLIAFDPASGKMLRSIDVAAHAGTAFDGQHLFQIAADRIQKIDPKSGRVLATIPAPGGGGDSGLAWAEGTLWVGQ